ncbi:MAG: AAA family ATPase, partial [Syntrophobacteraceae bacterium]
MKIMRLDLTACGPFTDVSLDLGRGKEGLHLIYGPNEAGKSSALRALGYFLFGIPERCEDVFKHTYQQLRIGGALRTGNGKTIEAVRRKGRANTLRAPDDSLLDETLWHEACGRISANEFSKRFGINHDALVAGGAEIVKGEGELADVLFAAGAGMASFRRIEEQVREEANELFKPGGSRPKINALLSTLREEQRRLRELQLPNEKWDKHFQNLQEALAEKSAVEAELGKAEQERGRLKRIRTALPLIGRRKGMLGELSGYASAPILPENFSEKRQKAVQSLRLEEQNAILTGQRIEKLRSESSGLKTSPAVLDFAGEISDLYQTIGSHRKASAERPKLVVQKKALEEQARELLGELRKGFPLERVEELRLRADEEIVIQNLGAKREKYAANLENALEKARDLTFEIAERNEKLASLPVPRDIAPLRTAIEEAKSCGRIEEELAQIEATLLNAEEQANIELMGLELWTGSLDELERLPAPDGETIDEFEKRFREAEKELENHGRELGKISGQIRKIEARVSELRAGEVVSVEDLVHARGVRETGWKLIRAAIEGGKVSEKDRDAFLALAPGAETIPDAFEKSVATADQLSDRLRREADRVADYNSQISARNTLELEKNEVERKKKATENILAGAQREWNDLWLPCSIAPASPDRMRRWTAKRADFLRRRMEIRKLFSEASHRANRIEELKGALAQCLLSFGKACEEGDSLHETVAGAAHLVEEETKTAAERERLGNELEQKKRELRKVESQTEKAKSELEQWRAEWESALSPLGLGSRSIPEQANAMLGKLQGLFAKLKEAKHLGQRIEEIDTDCEVFESQAAELVKLAAPELRGTSAEEAVRALHELLTNGRAEKLKKEELEKKARQEEAELVKTQSRIDKLKIELSGMLAEAACREIDDFPEAERRSLAKRNLLGKLEQIEEQLIELAAGLAIEQFATEAEGHDPDLLPPLIRQLDETIAQLNDRKSEVDQAIGFEKNELGRWDGRGDAAELAQQIQARLADLENRARSYARLRIAHALLLQAKERYREMSQGPVIGRASELFSALTLGSFAGIRAGDDKNVLVGLRANGDMVPARAMSDGSADQLYLALRLASFEHYASNNEPLPLVLDDILVQFDDERARAALRVLADVSSLTQLILFTHHRHLVDLAKSELDSDRLFVLELGC